MLDWLNFHLGEIIGLIHALEKRYYQNKTQLHYNFGSEYITWLVANETEGIQARITVGWLYWCFTVLQHILGHFGHGQLT